MSGEAYYSFYKDIKNAKYNYYYIVSKVFIKCFHRKLISFCLMVGRERDKAMIGSAFHNLGKRILKNAN